MEKQKKSGPTNDPATFPALNSQTLQGYAKRWAEMFPAIQRITLYGSDKDVVSSRYIIFVQISHRFNHELIKALYRAESNDERKKIHNPIYAEYDPETIKYLNWSWGHENAGHVMDQLEGCYTQRQSDYMDEWLWMTGSIEDPPPSEFIREANRWILFTTDSTEAIPQITVEGIDSGNSFICKGDFWSIQYEGNKINVQDLECVRYIVHLVEKPNQPFYSNHLKILVKGRQHFLDVHEDTDDQALGCAGFSIDGQDGESFTLSDMPIEKLEEHDKHKLEQIVMDLHEKMISKKKNGTEDELRKATEDFEKVKMHLSNEYGLEVRVTSKGPRFIPHTRLTNDAEKIRVAVRKQIVAGIKRIRQSNKSLAAHLKMSIITGAECMYRPDPSHPDWRVEWGR